MVVTDLYNAEFMDHVSHPDYKYQMDCPDCTHEGVNPSCGDELTFNPDVEGIVLTGLEEAYEAAVTEGTVPQKVLKQGDATQAGRGPGRGLY